MYSLLGYLCLALLFLLYFLAVRGATHVAPKLETHPRGEVYSLLAGTVVVLTFMVAAPALALFAACCFIAG